jgi:predicted RNA polymerase sigma factor
MTSGPAEGLALIDRITGLDRYHLWHSARADLLRRLGRVAEAAEAYGRALELATDESDRRFLTGRLAQLGH